MRLLDTDIARLLRAAGATSGTAAAWAPHYLKAMSEGAIDTPLRVAHFIAQTGHESAHFRTTVEYASGANYEWRKDLGNVMLGDGKRFKGRGLIQLTGRYNYTAFNIWLRKNVKDAPDVVKNPAIVAKMPWAMIATVWYWNHAEKSDGAQRSISVDADRGDTRQDVMRVTKRINGGYNGLTDRIAKFVAVMAVLRARPDFVSLKDQIEFGPREEVDIDPLPILEPVVLEDDAEKVLPPPPADDVPTPPLVKEEADPDWDVKPNDNLWIRFMVWLGRRLGSR